MNDTTHPVFPSRISPKPALSPPAYCLPTVYPDAIVNPEWYYTCTQHSRYSRETEIYQSKQPSPIDTRSGSNTWVPTECFSSGHGYGASYIKINVL